MKWLQYIQVRNTTTIVLIFFFFENKDETLGRQMNQSASEYIQFLKTKTSKKLQWNSFLETFEKSTFSDSEITLLEYN